MSVYMGGVQGLHMAVYWLSYFLVDGVITDLALALLCSLLALGGLFSAGSFFDIFALLFVFCISVLPFVFLLCSFFNNPQVWTAAACCIRHHHHTIIIIIIIIILILITWNIHHFHHGLIIIYIFSLDM
jgi:hypothetical protein